MWPGLSPEESARRDAFKNELAGLTETLLQKVDKIKGVSDKKMALTAQQDFMMGMDPKEFAEAIRITNDFRAMPEERRISILKSLEGIEPERVTMVKDLVERAEAIENGHAKALAGNAVISLLKANAIEDDHGVVHYWSKEVKKDRPAGDKSPSS
jgi:hypothetical protein